MTSFYTAGAVLPLDAPSYVERRADKDLYDGLLKGEFCYVLCAHQMGKSSLMNRTIGRLREYFNAVALDLKAIGPKPAPAQWYESLLVEIGKQLDLTGDLGTFWRTCQLENPARRFLGAMHDVILPKRPGPLLVFVDEVDSVLTLPFPSDDFFAAIRDCYQEREGNPGLKRLGFCLFGVATPASLVEEDDTTPFPLGRRVELTDFTDQEAAPLASGLNRREKESQVILGRVLYWTNGHPYLTQRLCLAIANDPSVNRPADVDRICEELFLRSRTQDHDSNLLVVRETILRSEANPTMLLTLYDQIRSGKPVVESETDPMHRILRLSGLANVAQGFLQVRNRIYQRVFDGDWVNAHLPSKSHAPSKSIAVLPFVNMSSDKENEYLSDGITEDLITALSQVEGLRVPARTSSFAFKGRNEDVRKIGEQLAVATVLEGSVRKAGNKLRITAQLIKVADGYHLWSAQYDREMEDVFAIQDEISRSIMQALKLQLAGEDEVPMVKRGTANAEAYQLYLKGRYFWKSRGTGLRKGILYFELALLDDPNYALAYAGIADTYNLFGFYGHLPPQEALPKAKAAASKALALDAGLAEGHNSLGFAKFIYDWDWAEAEKEFQQALDLSPNYVTARNWHARLLSCLERFDEAIAEDQHAVEIDPLSTYANMHLGWILLSARRYDQAIIQLRKTLALQPTGLRARCLLGQALLFQSKPNEAIAELQNAKATSKDNIWAAATLGYAHGVAGHTAQARAVLADLAERSQHELVRPTLFALVHTGLGELDQAFSWLEKAYGERDCWLVLVRADPAFDGLRTDSRFGALMKRIGLRQA